MTGFRPRTVSEAETRDFVLAFLPGETRKLRPTGIHIFNLRYWADWFCADIANARGDVEVRYDPRNISVIYVQDLSDIWQEVHLARPRAPFSLREHQSAKAAEAGAARATWDDETTFRAREEQRAILKDAARKSARARRQLEDSARGFEASAALFDGPAELSISNGPPSPSDPAVDAYLAEVGPDDEVEIW